MKIISLSSNTSGYACGIATSIKKYFYNNNNKTNIFDYLEISLNSINQFLINNTNDKNDNNEKNNNNYNKNCNNKKINEHIH